MKIPNHILAAHVLISAGILAFAIQFENWLKPPVMGRIVDAAQIKQRVVQVVEIKP